MKALSKIILITVLGIAGSILFFSLLVKPSLNRVSEKALQLQARKQQEATLQQQVFAYRTAQSDLSKATQRQNILSLLVDRENLVEAVKNLEEGARITGTSHELKIPEAPDPKLKPKPILSDPAGLIEVPYQLSTINDFLGTLRFLSQLEHLPQFTEISKLNLSAELIDSQSSQEPIRTGRVLGNFDGVFVITEKK